VWSICRRYQLDGAEADHAGQAVWLQLVDQIGQIRDPAALPGWLATTTRRECGRIVRAACRTQPPGHSLDVEDIPDEQPHRPTIRSRPEALIHILPAE
jgi:DNA-directed RNA polymerase specialized sigma24 family protein